MSAANLRSAAETMRREESAFFDAVAALLDPIDRLNHRLEQPYYALPLAVAETYLGDPGPVPDGPT